MEKVRYVSKIFYLLILILFFSCEKQENVYDHTNDIVELGQNYYYLADGKESQVLLNLKPDSNHKFGKTIISSEVIQYNFNDNYIIAKNKDLNGEEKFWIIYKQNELIDILDSISFYKKIEELNLKF